MSSSKIIRKGAEPPPSYTLGPLGEVVAEPPAPEPFRAINLGREDEEVEPEEEVEEEEVYQPPMILEEEALRRIQQAHADGLKEGKRQAEEDFAKVSEALAQALLATGPLRGRILQESEEDLLKLSVSIARTVLQRELSCDPWILASVVQGAVELASDAGEVVVRLSPADYQMVVQRPEFAVSPGEKRRVSLKEDAALPPGGCLVETARGTLDAGVESQLDQIYRRLCEERCLRHGGQGGN